MHHPFMDLTGALRSKEGESPGKTREVRDGIFEEASKPPIEQAVAQFVFEFSEGPALQMFEHDAAQQTIRSNAWPAKVLGTEAPPPSLSEVSSSSSPSWSNSSSSSRVTSLMADTSL